MLTPTSGEYPRPTGTLRPPCTLPAVTSRICIPHPAATGTLHPSSCIPSAPRVLSPASVLPPAWVTSLLWEPLLLPNCCHLRVVKQACAGNTALHSCYPPLFS